MCIRDSLYAMVRFACLERERNGKNFFYIIKNGCGCYFLGIGLGAVFLLPGILAFLGNARGGIKERGVESLLHYGLDFYNQMLAGVFAPEFTASYWTILSLAPMAAFGIVLVLSLIHICSRNVGRGIWIWFYRNFGGAGWSNQFLRRKICGIYSSETASL